ncbi:MAG TPA: hypothetical protein V6C76_12100 [Drouetiella sp.]
MFEMKRLMLGVLGASLLMPISMLPSSAAEKILAGQSTRDIKESQSAPNLSVSVYTPKNTRDDDPAVPMVTDALKLNAAKDAKGALNILTQAVAKYPQSPVAWAYKGMIEYYLNDYEGAVTDCGKAINLAPQFGLAYEYRGRGHMWKAKPDLDKALADLNESLKHFASGTDLDAWYNCGLASYNKGDFATAAAMMAVEEGLTVDWYWFHWYRGCSLHNIGMYDAAQAEAQLGMKSDPKNPDAVYLSALNYESSGVKDKAVAQYKAALSMYQAMNSSLGMGWCNDGLKRLGAM